MTELIYTRETECRDCYKCVRSCPVKAIRVQDNRASVIGSLCVVCGSCVPACPAGAKHVVSDSDPVSAARTGGEPFDLILAPSYRVHDRITAMIGTVLRQQFESVRDAADGAVLYNRALAGILGQGALGTHISGACPVIVALIRRHFPELQEALLPIPSPLGFLAREMKERTGRRVVFAGPCYAKGMERNGELADHGIDFVLTFDELADWMEGIIPCPGNTYEEELELPVLSGAAETVFPLEGGMLRSLEPLLDGNMPAALSFSGMEEVLRVLEECRDNPQDTPLLLELLACRGGCVNGPALGRREGFLRNLQSYQGKPLRIIPPKKKTDRTLPERNSEERRRAERILGKENRDDRLDCGGCGYDSCDDFITAFLEGKAEEQMCVTQMRRTVQDKFNALLETIPLSVVIMDDRSRIADCNDRFFRKFLGVEMPLGKDYLLKVRQISLEGHSLLSALFRPLLDDPGHSVNCQAEWEGRVFRCYLFAIRPGSLYGGVFKDITEQERDRQTVVLRAREVIEKNLSSVQKIASLLGENAAQTEILLNSLITVYDREEEVSEQLP